MTSTDLPDRTQADGMALQMLIQAICNAAGWEVVQAKPLGDESKVYCVRVWESCMNGTVTTAASDTKAATQSGAQSAK